MKCLAEYLLNHGYSKEDAFEVSVAYRNGGLDKVMELYNFEATGFVIRWANKAGETNDIIGSFLDEMDLAKNGEDGEDEMGSYKKRARAALEDINQLIREAKDEPPSKKRDKLLSDLKKLKKKTKDILKR